MEFTLDVRPSPIAGRWYPGDPRQLAASIDGYLNAARLPDLAGEVIAVMAPHAGHLYSGPVAGYSFAAVRGSTPELVAVVSPMHYPYPSPLLTTAHSAYETPLGAIPVEKEVLASLDAFLFNDLGFGLSPVRNDPEHSLEIELPFLQRSLGGAFKLLPVMVRDQSTRVSLALGKGLAGVLHGQKALLVASTDLSHFFQQEAAHSLDEEILHQVESLNPQGVLDSEAQGKGYACGKGALAAVLWAAQALGANQVHRLRYATSGDVTGDYDQVVGYAAAVLTRI
jgi:AmmeMemoRadiSam system protein B